MKQEEILEDLNKKLEENPEVYQNIALQDMDDS